MCRATCVLSAVLVAVLTAGVSGQEQQHATHRQPFILVLPAYRSCDALIEAWNKELGRPGDMVVVMPAPGDLENPARIEAVFRKVKRGDRGWVVASAEMVLTGKGKRPSSAVWLWYDLEPWHHTPQKEKDDPVAAVKSLREYCNKHNLKLGITPIYAKFEDNFNLELAGRVAAYCDAYILQCQDWQREPQRLQQVATHLRNLKQAIHKANPKCLVGCQLGTAQRYGGVEAALKLFEKTKDFIQLYTAWWEPEEQSVMQLLRTLRSSD